MTALAALLVLQAGPATVEDFRAAFAAARGPSEKAACIRAFAEKGPRDDAAAVALARGLAVFPDDPFQTVPLAAAEALGRFRGSAAAGRALAAALPAYRAVPGLRRRLLDAIGRVGHPSLLAVVEQNAVRPDPDLASAALRALGGFPRRDALDALFRIYDRRPPGEGADPAREAVLKEIHRLSGESYPSVEEMRIWWGRRREAFGNGLSDAPPADSTPLPVIELLFREGAGNAAANSGLSAAAWPSAVLTQVRWPEAAGPGGVPPGPAWARPASVAEIGAPSPADVRSFTITMWIRAQAVEHRPEIGRRLLAWSGRKGTGVDWVRRGDGSLQLALAGAAERSPARSPAGRVPAAPAEGDPEPAWRFVAAAWDGTTLRFYVGSRQEDAIQVSEHPMGRPETVPGPARLWIGNAPPWSRSDPDTGFRGLLDDVRVFVGAGDLPGALSREQIVRVQNREVRE